MAAAPDSRQEALIRAAYDAFNRRDIDGALEAMTADVDWPNGWEGGYVHGHEGIRDYWTRQWNELDPSVTPVVMAVDDDGRVAVTVAQRIRQPDGELLHAGEARHVYTFRDGLVARMDIDEGES